MTNDALDLLHQLSKNEKKKFDQIAYLAVLSVVFFIPFSKGAIEVSLILGLIAYFFSRFVKQEEKIKLQSVPLLTALILYFVAVVLSILTNPFLPESIRGLFKTLKYLGLYFIVSGTVTTEEKLKWLLQNFCYSFTDSLKQSWPRW